MEGKSKAVQFWSAPEGMRQRVPIPEGLGHRGEHPPKSGNRNSRHIGESARRRGMPNRVYNAYASTAPVSWKRVHND